MTGHYERMKKKLTRKKSLKAVGLTQQVTAAG